MRPGKREEVEGWMKKHNIRIMVLQETYVKQNTREVRKGFTWYFSGENKTGREWTAGVAIIVETTYVKYIEDIEPINDRLMHITIRGTMPITLICVYIPQGARTTEEKEEVYEQLEKYTRKRRAKDQHL